MVKEFTKDGNFEFGPVVGEALQILIHPKEGQPLESDNLK
jgi:hypothetical protein